MQLKNIVNQKEYEVTQEDTRSMARKVWGEDAILPFTEIERFAALVAAAEREACAKLAQETVCDTHIPTGIQIYGTKVAKAIRARSMK